MLEFRKSFFLNGEGKGVGCLEADSYLQLFPMLAWTVYSFWPPSLGAVISEEHELWRFLCKGRGKEEDQELCFSFVSSLPVITFPLELFSVNLDC